MSKDMILDLSKMIGKALHLVQSGLGWEVWCDGMEITQFTYFQQMTGIECKPIPVELTYGLKDYVCLFKGKKIYLILIGTAKV